MKQGTNKHLNVRNMVQIAMLGAIAAILMLVELPLWFAPTFYKIDFSEVPVLIGAFAMGPVAGMFIELIKVLLNFVLNGTVTAGVGELANFLIGCALVIPASICYRRVHTRKGAIIGLVIGTITMVVVGSFLNAYVLLPAYAMAFEMKDMTPLIQMGGAVNPMITSLSTFILYAVAPFNALKGVITSIVTIFLYKKIRFLLQQRK